MGWKCSVAGCRSGYPEDTSGASFYRYPSNEEERSYWINKLPNKDFVYTEGKRICSKHWPSDAKMIKVKGRLKPGCPPTKFEDVPQSCLPQTDPLLALSLFVYYNLIVHISRN